MSCVLADVFDFFEISLSFSSVSIRLRHCVIGERNCSISNVLLYFHSIHFGFFQLTIIKSLNETPKYKLCDKDLGGQAPPGRCTREAGNV